MAINTEQLRTTNQELRTKNYLLYFNEILPYFGMLEVYSKHTEEMKRHIEMLNALFKHATEGIIVVDNRGTIAMVNPTAMDLFGYEEEVLIGPVGRNGRGRAHRADALPAARHR